MIRLEIIMDRTVEDIFLDHIESLKADAAGCGGSRPAGAKPVEKPDTKPAAKPACFPYTLISEAKGEGASGPRMGSHVWPEENSLFILYVEEQQLEKVRAIIEQMRRQHPSNGIAGFYLPAAEELI